VSESLQD